MHMNAEWYRSCQFSHTFLSSRSTVSFHIENVENEFFLKSLFWDFQMASYIHKAKF